MRNVPPNGSDGSGRSAAEVCDRSGVSCCLFAADENIPSAAEPVVTGAHNCVGGDHHQSHLMVPTFSRRRGDGWRGNLGNRDAGFLFSFCVDGTARFLRLDDYRR